MGIEAEATELLRRLTGRADAQFRDGQLEAIDRLVEGRERVLVVQRTGWGKSAVYFIATRLLRDRGAGPTLLVSPLLALMRNQIAAAERMGVRAETINSSNKDAWDAVQAALQRNEIDLLLIAPERLANHQFRTDVLPTVGGGAGLLVVDEAHCISDWGHDFRPDYRKIVRVLDLLPSGVPVLCCTATANNRVVADIEHQLGSGLTTIRGPLGRDGLELAVVELPRREDRLAWLRTVIPTLPGTGIVYCLTVADAELVARCLTSHGVHAISYTGADDPDARLVAEHQLLDNDVKVVVATSALGMGFDKPDLSFVIHYQAPGSPIAYYQQVGRAGRALDRSLGVLLRGVEDEDVQDWFITTAFPDRVDAEAVVRLLEESDEPRKTAEIETVVNVRRGRLENMLKQLEVDGAVERLPSGAWIRTARHWSYPQERVEAVTAARRAEQQQMRDYAAAGECRMRFLRRLLDDPHLDPCGICDVCAGQPRQVSLPADLVASMASCIRGRVIVIEPRKQWPTGMDEVRGRIQPAEQVKQGIALSRWGDGGWGDLVRSGKYEDERFADDLVQASVKALGQLDADEPATWVTCVPSRRAPGLVPDFARRLAGELGLPFHEVVVKTRETERQKAMENSAQQVRNLLGAFEVDEPVPSGPVLLVDDLSDSRWTCTIVGRELRLAGVPAVYPFALASTSAQ